MWHGEQFGVMYQIVLRNQTWNSNSPIPTFQDVVSLSQECPLVTSAETFHTTWERWTGALQSYTSSDNTSLTSSRARNACSTIDIYDRGCLISPDARPRSMTTIPYPGDCSIACVPDEVGSARFWDRPDALHNCMVYPLISRLLSEEGLSPGDTALVKKYGYHPEDYDKNNESYNLWHSWDRKRAIVRVSRGLTACIDTSLGGMSASVISYLASDPILYQASPAEPRDFYALTMGAECVYPWTLLLAL